MSRRYVVSVFTLALFMAGTATVSLSGLGTAAVSAPMFALSKITPLSFGTWFFIVNGIYFAAQLVLLRGDFPKRGFLQLPVMVLTSAALDFWVYLLGFLRTDVYLGQLAVACGGTIIVAMALAVLVAANVLFMPTDGIVNTIAQVFRLPFGKVKFSFDIISVLVTIALTLLFLDEFNTVREATIISAFVGPLAARFMPLARKIAG